MSLAKTIRQFFLVLRLQARQAWFHRAAAIGTIVTWSLRSGITVLLYHGIYKIIGTGSIKNISFEVAASSTILYAIYSSFSTRDISKIVNSDYKSGAIEIWLNKPVSYLAFKIAEIFGRNIPVIVTLLVLSVGFFSIGGLPNVDHLLKRLLLGILLLWSGVVIGCLLSGLIGLSVIWLKDNSSLHSIIDKIIMIFGGSYLPLTFFPPYFRLMGESLPTGAVTFISQIFYPDFFDNLPRFIITQLFWIIILGIALSKVSQAANRNMTVNGG